MAWAAAHVDPAEIDGRLVVALVCDEETGGEGIEAIRGELPAFSASVVGEPTELDVCPGQRGLFRAAVTARGRACHASRPWEGENAIEKAARDVLAIQSLDLGGEDPMLGPPTLEATIIHGGTRPNVLPGECTIELDGRPTPGCDNARMQALLEGAVEGEVQVRSNRFLPVSTPADARIAEVAAAASPTQRVRGFGGVSDLFHVREVPGVVMGPGTSAASHAPDEWVAVAQVEAAVSAYGRIARAYLGGEGA
jgi:acetylornithine deacetylase